MLYGAQISVAAYYMVSMGHGNPCPGYMLYTVHGYPCPRLIWYIWGTDIRAGDVNGSIVARKSVPAFYMVHMGHGYPCLPLKWSIAVWKYVPTVYMPYMGHGNPFARFTLYIWETF